MTNGKVIFGCVDIGDPEDNSFKLIRYLKEADIVVCESQKIHKLLDYFNIDLKAELFSHDYSRSKSDAIGIITVAEIKKGKNVLILSDDGHSLISDSGIKFLRLCQQNNIEFEIMTGPSAVTTVALHSNLFNKTHKLFNDHGMSRFSFEGLYDYIKPEQKTFLLNEINKQTKPAIIYFTDTKAIETIEEIMQAVGKEKLVSLCIDLTMKTQRVYNGTILQILNIVKDLDLPYTPSLVIDGNYEETE
jgi:16S rRNA (cytidine1402-2'-O)-methyltransferase